MTRLFEITYFAALPLGFAALLGAIGGRKPRLRIALATSALALVAGWLLDARWLSDRSTLLLNHYEAPRTAQDVVDWFGQPDKIVAYPEGDYSWIYAIAVPPFRTQVVYAVFHNQLVGRKAAETLTTLDTSGLRPVPRPVLEDVADRDPITWAILPITAGMYNNMSKGTNDRCAVGRDDDFIPNRCAYGRWQPDPKDIPAIIGAAYDSLWLSSTDKPKKGFELISDEEKRVWDRDQRNIDRVLVNGPIYACQIIGYEENGKKKIHLNFFPKKEFGIYQMPSLTTPGTTEPRWHAHYVMVCDGGALFWQIEYDSATKTFADFRINGP